MIHHLGRPYPILREEVYHGDDTCCPKLKDVRPRVCGMEPVKHIRDLCGATECRYGQVSREVSGGTITLH